MATKKRNSQEPASAGKQWLKRDSFNSRQVILWASFFMGLILAVFVSASFSEVFGKWGAKASISAQVVIQDLLAFTIPAYIAAKFASAKPLTFVRLTAAPTWKAVAYIVLLFIVMLPGMNYIVYLNECLTLPQSLSALEQWMRATEQAAQSVTNMLLDGNSLPAMLGCVLLVGVLTGFSEEIFFRGALQKIFEGKNINAHVTIWFVAIVFSVLHFQFFGFVPRMLLGALFGYLVYWSGSLWTSVIAHALNNSVVVVSKYLISRGIISTDIDSIGLPAGNGFPALAIISLLLACFLISRHRLFLGR